MHGSYACATEEKKKTSDSGLDSVRVESHGTRPSRMAESHATRPSSIIQVRVPLDPTHYSDSADFLIHVCREKEDVVTNLKILV